MLVFISIFKHVNKPNYLQKFIYVYHLNKKRIKTKINKTRVFDITYNALKFYLSIFFINKRNKTKIHNKPYTLIFCRMNRQAGKMMTYFFLFHQTYEHNKKNLSFIFMFIIAKHKLAHTFNSICISIIKYVSEKKIKHFFYDFPMLVVYYLSLYTVLYVYMCMFRR